MSDSAASLVYDPYDFAPPATATKQVVLKLFNDAPRTVSATTQLNDTPRATSATTQLNGKFASHFAKLQALEVDQALWVEGAEPPNDFALAWARLFLQQLQSDDFSPAGVLASAEGGVGIYFVDGSKYADLECLNSGAILGVISNRRDRPFAWEVEQDAGGLACASQRVREFFDTAKTTENVPKRSDSRQPVWSIRALVSSLRSRGHGR